MVEITKVEAEKIRRALELREAIRRLEEEIAKLRAEYARLGIHIKE